MVTIRTIRKKQGFTLIELLLVLVVIALLLSIVVPNYFKSIDKSKDVALEENLKVIRVSLDQFYADNARFPDTLEELVEKRYLREVPIDPVTESSQTWLLLEARDENVTGIEDVNSGAQGETYDGRRYETL